MSTGHASLTNFTAVQVDRLRGFRHHWFGNWELGAPRYLPTLKDIFFVRQTDGEGKTERYLDAFGRQEILPKAIIDKMLKLGLLDEVDAVQTSGTALSLNEWGVQLMIQGETDRTINPPARYTSMISNIRDTMSADFGTDSLAGDIRERNSVKTRSKLEDKHGAVKVGYMVTPSATMAIAYDGAGLRITDILVDNFAAEPNWLQEFCMEPDNREPVTDYDLLPVMRFANMFGVSRDKVFPDRRLVDDIIQGRNSIFDESKFTRKSREWSLVADNEMTGPKI
jgi:hypothetical protein